MSQFTIDCGDELAESVLPQHRQRYVGPWPAVVVDTKDPEKRGRIKARAPQVWGDPATEVEYVPDADLPWAFPAFPAHEQHVPSVGDGVIIMFWGSRPSSPIWFGQFLGGDDAFEEFTSSYSPEPKTRMIRTANGHVVEMRWVDGQEKIRIVTAAGLSFEMCEPTTLDGPKIKLALPDGKLLELDGKTQNINITAPTGQVNVTALLGAVNVTGQGVNIKSTAAAPSTVIGGGTFTSNFVGAANYTFGGLLAFVVAGVFTVTAATFSLTAALISMVGVVSLGIAGVKYKLAHAQVFVLLQDMLHVQASHTHAVTTAPGTTGVSDLTTSAQAGNPPRAGGLSSVPPGNVSMDVLTMSTVSVEAN